MTSSTLIPLTGPRLAIIGGRLELDNADILEALRSLTGGRIAVFATASNHPEEVGAETVQEFADLGFGGVEEIPLYWSNRKTAAFDTQLIRKVRDIGHVYFTGGDQANIINSLVQNGADTPMLEAIRALGRSGGLVAGSSAGAAMMSSVSIYGGTSMESVVSGVAADPDEPGLLLGEGLNFFPYGIVDQHFIKRGRIGRLMVALIRSGQRYGFGVDENTGLFVEGDRARVRGELGVLMLDAGEARYDEASRSWTGCRVSFLGTGDQYCFSTGEITPAPGKRALAPEDCAHLESRRMTRSVFGTYAFYEMLVRLAEANPEYYCQESASAYDHELQQMASLILTYRPDESRAWRDDNPEEYRYSLCNYGLDIQVETQSREARQVWLKRYATDLLGDNTLIDPQARLVMVGGPLRAGDDGGVIGYLASFAPRRMGVLGTASHEPGCQARRYVDLLRDYGLPAEDLNITLENSLYQSRDPGVEAAILDCDMVLLCGGSQQRLIDALLYHGEGSRLLKALIRTWTRGATLVGVSGAASVFSRMMICGGNSYDAFYFGRAIDVSQKGVDIEEGFHLFRFGMVDQNVHERYRLGRLIYACASENERFGFGVLENSAMVDTGNAGVLEAVGEAGFIVVDLGQARKVMNMTRVQVDGIRVRLVRPGQCFRVAGNRVEGTPATSERAVALDDVLEELLFHFHYQAHPDDRAEGLGALTMGVEVLSPDDLLLDMGMMREKLIPRDQRMIDREN